MGHDHFDREIGHIVFAELAELVTVVGLEAAQLGFATKGCRR